VVEDPRRSQPQHFITVTIKLHVAAARDNHHEDQRFNHIYIYIYIYKTRIAVAVHTTVKLYD